MLLRFALCSDNDVLLDIGEQSPRRKLSKLGGTTQDFAFKLRRHYGNFTIIFILFALRHNLRYALLNLSFAKVAVSCVHQMSQRHAEQHKSVFIFDIPNALNILHFINHIYILLPVIKSLSTAPFGNSTLL
jgi:hypothetical protein